MKFAWGASFASFALGLGCGKPVTDVECTRMLDRYVAQKLLADPTLLSSTEREKHDFVGARVNENHERAIYRQRHAECARDVSRRQFKCAIDAVNPDQWEGCFD